MNSTVISTCLLTSVCLAILAQTPSLNGRWIEVNLLVEPENLHAVQFYKGLGYSEVRFIFFTKEL